MKATNETDLKKGYSSHNAFPQRNKRTGNHLIMNMLFKYDRHFGSDKSIEEKWQSESEKEKKIKGKYKWFKKKPNFK